MMLTRTPAADKQRVAVDEETVRKFVSLIHEQAARALNGIERPGVLQLTRLHPLDKKLVPTRFRIDDVDGMTKQAIADAKAGHNAYVEARTVAEGTPPHKRGDINDTGFVFALVVDSDADKGQATNRDLSRLASLVIETSPGNRHYWFFLNQAVRAGDAQPVGEAMRQALGTDSDTGTVTQPYRVAGTPNYPGKAKRKRGRTTVERTFIIDAQPDRSWTLDELRLQFSGPKQKSGGGKRDSKPSTNNKRTNEGRKSDSNSSTDYRSLLEHTDAADYGSDRSGLLFAALRRAILAGLDDAAIMGAFLDPAYAGNAIYEHCRDNGKTDEKARAYLARQIERAREKVSEQFKQYFEKDGGIYWNNPRQDGAVRLANFVARIIDDVKVDDGSEQMKRLFTIRYSINGREGIANIAADKFEALNWVTLELGADACITPGPQIRAHLANAIKSMDQDGRRTGTVYAHLGWRKINGQWLYLHADGAIGEEGPVRGIRVELDGELSRFALPTEPVADPRAALGASLRMLEMASKRIAWPLLAVTYLAPLGEFVPITVALFFTGGTGTRKSAMQAVAQGHWYWEHDGKKLPANWSSTANSLEAVAFRAKDTLLVVDDFCPRGTSMDIQRYHHTAERLVRAQGNHAGRGRMNADGSLRTEMHPRGLLAASGEDTPSGHSLRARMMICEISPDDVNLPVLTEMQKAVALGTLKEAMASYIKYVAGQDKGLLKKRFAELRTEARKRAGGGHTRTPENAALLMLGVENLLGYAEHVGLEIDVNKLKEEGWEALLVTGKEQDRHQRDEQPAERFKALLQGLLSSGRAHLCDACGSAPPGAHMLGWIVKEYGDKVMLQPSGPSIGWIIQEDLFLEPNATYAELQQLAQKQGQALALTQGALWKRLREAGLLEPCEEGRHSVKKTISGHRRRVLHFKRSNVFEIETETAVRVRDEESDEDII